MTENVSAISYTNKDFQTIYPEILDLATRISERWTPDQSNESDPGIVLAKISAICADKNNYNIDKNVLECFPSSVTQMPNAREIYAQRGYYMHWYQSGTGKVSLAWKGDKSDTSSITFKDKFVAVTGNDNQIVYTIIPTSNLPIICDGTSTEFHIIQGVAKEYTTTSGSNVITLEDIDSENRIYFPNTSVAENGIFIKRQDVTEFSLDGWRRVDNLDSHALGQDIYEFGVSRDGSACYIEFPDDVAERIGDGINLWYIATDGLAGNIKPKYLTKFTGTVKATQITQDGISEVDLSTDNISFSQADSVSNCKDYESIEEAYRGYKRTIGTFDTLVTLRDYDNALRDSGIVPNGFVTDRTNDIQRSCQIMTEQNDMNVVESHINRTNGKDEMTAFDLCIYAFQYMPKGTIQSDGVTDYNNTFYMAPNKEGEISSEIGAVKAYVEEQKSIQHNFVTWGADKILCIKNKYEVKCQIIPKYSITTLQELSIKQNILSALYNALNSSKVEFGEEITYDKVYDIIESADERIKSVSLANIEFTPYASVYDSQTGKVVDKRINSLVSDQTQNSAEAVEIFAKSVLAGVTPLFDLDKSIEYSLIQSNPSTFNNVESLTTSTTIPLNVTGTKLLKNESVVFYTPSMVETYQFTLGVKVVSSFDIQNDVMTTKIGNAYVDVTFLWKSDNKYYAQRFYGSDNNSIGVKANISKGIKLYNNYNTFQSLPNGIKTDITNTIDVQSVWDKLQSIQASETVSVYELNQRTTASSDKCYWILNHTEPETVNNVTTYYYVLFNKGSRKDSYYVLDSNEYFIVADSQLVNATVYGAGTKIILNEALPNGANDKGMRVEVDPSAYKKFVEEGISALSNGMVNGLNLTIQEREFVALGEGTTVFDSTAVSLTNQEAPITGEVRYQLSDGTEYTLPTLSGLTRTARSRLAFNTSNGAMVLEGARQSVNVSQRQFNGSNSDPVYIQSSPAYNLAGGENTNLTYSVVGQGDDVSTGNATIYVYQQDVPTGVSVGQDGSLSLPNSTVEKEISFAGKLNKSSIFVVTKNAGDEFAFNKSAATPIRPDTSDHSSTKLYYWIYSDIDSLVVTYKNANSNTSISISPMYGLTINSALQEHTEVMNTILALDQDNQFNYMYTVPTESRIDNPLLGSSFMNVNHPYNQFTICQLNTDGTSIDIFGKLNAR